MSEKNVPNVRFKGFSESWEQRQLGSVVEMIDGDRGKNYPHESDFQNTGYTLFLDTGNVRQTGFNFSNLKYIDKGKDEQLNNGQLKINDFVLTSRGTLGNVGFYSAEIAHAFPRIRINSAMLILRLRDNETIDTKYLLSLLHGNLVDVFLKKYHVGSAQPHITKRDFSKLKIRIPDNEVEQSKIGEALLNLENIIASNQRKLDQLKEVKKLLMQKIFDQEWRFEGFTDPWEQRKLNKIANFFDNKRIPVTASDRKSGNIPYYGANGIQDFVNGFTHDGEYILIAEDGASDLVNYPVNYVKGKIWVNNHAHVVNGKSKILDTLFLGHRMNSINMVKWLVGGGRAKLNGDILKQIPISVPKYQEQVVIGTALNKCDKLIASNQQKLDQLKEMKKWFMQNMFV